MSRRDAKRTRKNSRELGTLKYTNDSEYIRDLIRREQERSAELEAVRAELIAGERSGKARPFNAIGFKQRMRATRG